MTEKDPLRVAIIGTAKRSDCLYGPIIKALSDEAELVSVWGRSKDSTQWLSESLAIPGYTDIELLIRETAPQIGIVSVNYNANGEVGLMAVEAGLHVLLETPIAHKLDEADAIIAAAGERGLKIEIAGQFHRRPLEQIKLKLIETGLFGRVHTSFNDFAGHGYHGVSVLRSYLGFDSKPVQASGAVREYELTSHWSRLADSHSPRTETQEYGIIEFEGGRSVFSTGRMSATTRPCVGGAAADSWPRRAWASPSGWAWTLKSASPCSARAARHPISSPWNAAGSASMVAH